MKIAIGRKAREINTSLMGDKILPLIAPRRGHRCFCNFKINRAIDISLYQEIIAMMIHIIFNIVLARRNQYCFPLRGASGNKSRFAGDLIANHDKNKIAALALI